MQANTTNGLPTRTQTSISDLIAENESLRAKYRGARIYAVGISIGSIATIAYMLSLMWSMNH